MKNAITVEECMAEAERKVKSYTEHPLPASGGSAAGHESEICRVCEGFGRIQVRLASEGAGIHASYPTQCKTCGGTGRIAKRQPQENAKLRDAGESGVEQH